MRILKIFLAIMFGIQTFQPAEAQVDTNWFGNLEYRSLGPQRGGRSCAVTGVSGNRNLFYMGTTGGGVWKTENGGASWKNISDGFFGGSIGCVSVAKSDDNVIYVGQGEETVRGNVSSGQGIWKSVDAGVTWKFVGLKESRHVPAIAIHPQNPEIAFAAVLGDLFMDSETRGLYRTTDGGFTWSRVLFANQRAGCNEVMFDPLNHRIMYASTWNVRRSPYSFSSGGDGSDLWKSQDGGSTWEKITGKSGLPEGIVGKITIAPSSVRKNLIYIVIEHANKGGLYRSEDGGEHWKYVNGQAEIRQRAWYFSRVYADPKDDNTVYVMNVRFEKSTDGGKTFKDIATPHVDHHGLWIDPADNQRMIVANDGGGQVTYNGGQTWSSYYNQPTEQFYRVTTDVHVPYRIYGAQQDNSTMRVDHLTGRWEATAGGESAHLAPDPENPEIVYGGSYGGYLTRHHHEKNETRGINVWPDNPLGYGAEGMRYRFQWNFPLFFSPHTPGKLYAASNHLHVSFNEGESWEIISPDLTRNDPAKLQASGGDITKDNTGVEYYCTIFAAAESPLEMGVIYTGSDDGLVHITRDGGKNWTNITPKQMPDWAMINCIEADPHVKGKLYVVATCYKSGDNKPYLFISSDYGASWTLAVNGINSEHFMRAVRVDKVIANLLYSGTEGGMYISYNGGKNWQTFQRNLPLVPITDLAQVENDLVVATQGRGFWIIDQLDAVRKAQNATSRENFIAGVEGGYNMGGYQARMLYFLADSLKKKQRLIIDVLDGNNQVIRTFCSGEAKSDTLKIKSQKGFNYFSWDLHYPEARKPDDMILWSASLAGPMAAPGQYKFRLTLDEKSLEAPFTIRSNPNAEADSVSQIKKFEFMLEVNKKVDETHKVYEEMKTLKGLISGFMRQHHALGEQDSLILMGKAMNKTLDSLMNDLYQTKMKSEQDPINYPIKLNNKLAHLNSLAGMGSYGPTQQLVEVKNELIRQIDDRIARFNEMNTREVPVFNELIHQKRLPIIQLSD